MELGYIIVSEGNEIEITKKSLKVVISLKVLNII